MTVGMPVYSCAASGFGGTILGIAASSAFAYLLAAVSVLHLTACLLHRDGLRKTTKVFIVPLVICLHVSLCGFKYPLLAAGLVCGWLGDIFLIPKDRKLTFYVGALFFMAGHVLYILTCVKAGLPQSTFAKGGVITVSFAIPAAAATGFAGLWFLRRRISGKMLVAFMCYMVALLTMAGTMIYSSFGLSSALPAVMIALGAALFAVSDFLLGAGIARAFKVRNSRFWVMLTYILAQTGIALGFALI